MVFKIQTLNHKVNFHKIFLQGTVTFHKTLLTIPCEKIKLWRYVNFYVQILNTINEKSENTKEYKQEKNEQLFQQHNTKEER